MKLSARTLHLNLPVESLQMEALPPCLSELLSPPRQLEKQTFLWKEESTGVGLHLGWTLGALVAKPTARGAL